MRTEGFFDWLGAALGQVIRFIIDLFGSVLGGLADAVHDFLHGMARSIGMDDSYISFVVLAIGLLLLYLGPIANAAPCPCRWTACSAATAWPGRRPSTRYWRPGAMPFQSTP